MSATHPTKQPAPIEEATALYVPALLEEADKIIRNEYRVTIIRAIVADLETRGITTNQFMIAGEILEYFDRLHLEPTNPADALGIFLGLEGELELRKIVRRNGGRA